MGKIDEVRPTAMHGLYEVRMGTDVFYTDAKGNYVIQGELIDTKARRNLTEDRINKLTAVDFSQLPLKDAFTIVRGDGKRKVAVFEDPNCGYCKRFERDLQNVDNITVYLFLYPILSPDSAEKSRNVWCAKDRRSRLARHDGAREAARRRQLRHRRHAAQPGLWPQAQDHRHPHADFCQRLARARRHQCPRSGKAPGRSSRRSRQRQLNPSG